MRLALTPPKDETETLSPTVLAAGRKSGRSSSGGGAKVDPNLPSSTGLRVDMFKDSVTSDSLSTFLQARQCNLHLISLHKKCDCPMQCMSYISYLTATPTPAPAH